MEGDNSKVKCTCANLFRIYACKSDIHACICGESFRTCIAKEHVCMCYVELGRFRVNNNEHCKSHKHICVCNDEHTRCRALDHKCMGNYYDTKYCRSTKRHTGQCARGITPEQIRNGMPGPLYMNYCTNECRCRSPNGPSGCKCVIHMCVCPVAGCRSVYHTCKCNDDGAKSCRAQIHVCICYNKNGRACLSESHTCICVHPEIYSLHKHVLLEKSFPEETCVKCISIRHKCVCIALCKNDVCMAESHVCVCTKTGANENCRSQNHECTCTNTRTNDSCKSQKHVCTCKMVVPGNMFPYIDSRFCKSRDGHSYFSEPTMDQTEVDLISFD